MQSGHANRAEQSSAHLQDTVIWQTEILVSRSVPFLLFARLTLLVRSPDHISTANQLQPPVCSHRLYFSS